MPQMLQLICRLLLLLLWTTTTTTKTLSEGAKCPSPCRCYQQSAAAAVGGGGGGGIYSIVCVGGSLREIPQSFDFYAQILNFTGNSLGELANKAFRSVYLQRLEIVDLSDNGIKRVARDALAQLKNLLELDLSGNRIDAIRAAIFKNNRFLNTIRLSGNPIKVLGERAFPLSVYLRTLHLQGCQLRRVHRYAFFSAPLLQHLNLKDNALESPPMTVLRLTQLRTLQLDGNPFKCDDRLRRVLLWLLRHATTDGDRSQSQSQSMLCVFGETQNAVFWHTMEVQVGDQEQTFHRKLAGRRRRRRRRRRRARRRRRKRAIGAPVRKSHMAARHQKTTGTGTGTGGVIFETEPEWMMAANSYEHPLSTWNLTLPVPVHCTQHYEYSPTRFLKNHYGRGRDKWKLSAGSIAANVTVNPTAIAATAAVAAVAPHPIYNNAKVALNYVERARQSRNVDTDADAGAAGTRIRTNAPAPFAELRLSSSSPGHAAADLHLRDEYNESGGDGDNFIERNHAIILGAEVVLIVILLIILYHLWKENRKRVRSADAAPDAATATETGVNIPLNNGGARVKSYDTQTEGYKRYSLSDEEYSNIRNGAAAADDEGKYDAESGYLSYHRYNSVEGDNPGADDYGDDDGGGDVGTHPKSRSRCCNGGVVAADETRLADNFRRSRRGRTHELQHSYHGQANTTNTVSVADARLNTATDHSRAHGHSTRSFSDNDDDDQQHE